MSARVVRHLNSLNEESRYLRGLRAWVGFRPIGVNYEREARSGGKSKYSAGELMRLALNGIFNFSSFPAKLALYLGATRMGLAVLYFGYTLFRYFVFQDVPKGFTTLLFTIIFFSGIQFTILGLMGEYILRIFFQVKSRPNYIVRKRLRFGEEVHEEDSESLSLRQ